MSISTSGQSAYVTALINANNYTPIFPISGPYSWTGNSGQAATVSYSFNIATLHWEGRGTSSYITQEATLSGGQQSAVINAMTKWANVANITFVAATDNSNLTFAKGEISGNPAGFTALSDSNALDNNNLDGADIYIDDDIATYNPGEWGFATVLHEIGHSLGLQHATGTYDADVTIMSYDDGAIVENVVNAASPMIYDIAAAQFLYGANYDYNDTNTTYTLNSANSHASTIWDGGGIDTITLSNTSSTVAATIDLRGGVDENGNPYWSHWGNEYMAIAFDALDTLNGGVVNIENATGGAGNDTIYGNDLANDIDGGAGIDEIYYGGGNDTINLDVASGEGDIINGGEGMDHFILEGSLDNLVFNHSFMAELSDDDGKFRLSYDEDAIFVGSGEGTAGANYNYGDGTLTLVLGGTGSDLYLEVFSYAAPDHLAVSLGERLRIANLGNGVTNISEYLHKNNLIHLNSFSKFDVTIDMGSFVQGTSGNDTLAAQANSRLQGGGGADTFTVSSALAYHAVINDYTAGQGDVIDLTAFDGQISSLASIVDDDGGTSSAILTLPRTGDDITVALNGYEAGDVLTSFFLSNTLDYGTGDTIYGTSSDDTIFGTSGNDTIYCEAGNDFAVGGTGNDAVYGWTLNDQLWGGYGQDTLFGDDGNDTLNGDSGNDLMLAGNGADVLFGSDGNDTISGEGDNDLVNGEAGNDSVYGGAGADSVYGGTGNDTLFGEAGSDTLSGEAGNDNLYGGNDADYLYGGDDSDALGGEAGSDLLYGEAGSDWLEGGADGDWIDGGDGGDGIIGGAGVDGLNGGAGADIFYFFSASESGPNAWSRDYVYDFAAGTDKIDVNAIADSFTWLSTGAFTGTSVAEGRYFDVSGHRVFELDADGNGTADFQLEFVTLVGLGYSDFV